MELSLPLRRRFRERLLGSVPSRFHIAINHVLGRYGSIRNPQDIISMANFLASRSYSLSMLDRWNFLARHVGISLNVESFHTHTEMLELAIEILSLDRDSPGCIVEAGCFKGGSTSKLSIAAKIAGRHLFVFDSFAGLPTNTEPHRMTMYGGRINFSGGQYSGALDEVRDNVRQNGEIDTCTFVQGWFEQAMPTFNEPVAVAFIDVDLVSSTKTCMKHLYPLLVPNGVIYSQDGHVPLVAALLDDEKFWVDEVGVPKPRMQGLHERKLVRIVKG
jgi:O-methyltransferase